MGRGTNSGVATISARSTSKRSASKKRLSLADDALAQSIRAVLTEDLLKPEYRGASRPFTGHCYVASEAYYHLSGGKDSGLKSKVLRHEGSTHWWLENPQGQVTDLTAEQFETPVPYEQGRGTGFLTLRPSKRGQTAIERIQAA